MPPYFGGMTPGDGWIVDLKRYLEENELPSVTKPTQQERNMPNEEFIVGSVDSSGNV